MKFTPSSSGQYSTIVTGLVVGLIVFVAGIFSFSVTTMPNPSIVWITAIALTAWTEKKGVLPAVFIGHLLAGFFPLSPHPFVHGTPNILLLNILTGFFICLSCSVVLSIKPFAFSRYWIIITITLILLGWLTLQQPDTRIVFVYFAASTITGVLSGMKNMSTGAVPSQFFVSFLSGYIPWMTAIRYTNLDPSYGRTMSGFIRRYILVPFAMYILLILIAGQIVFSLKSGRESNQ